MQTKRRRALLVALVATIIASVTMVVPGSFAEADPGPNYNSPDYWETTLPGGSEANQCFDHQANQAGGSTNAHGSSSGNTVTLNPFNQSWFGDHYSLLVVKGGNVDLGNGPGNNVYPKPVAGTPYAAPNNAGGQPANVSHWIVCKGKVETQTTTVTPGQSGSIFSTCEPDLFGFDYTRDPIGPNEVADPEFTNVYLFRSFNGGPFLNTFGIEGNAPGAVERYEMPGGTSSMEGITVVARLIEADSVITAATGGGTLLDEITITPDCIPPETTCESNPTLSHTFDPATGSGKVWLSDELDPCDPVLFQATGWDFVNDEENESIWPQTLIGTNLYSVTTTGQANAVEYIAPGDRMCEQVDIYIGHDTLPQTLIGPDNPFEPEFLHQHSTGPNPTWAVYGGTEGGNGVLTVDCHDDPVPPIVTNAECGILGTLPNGTQYATTFTAVAVNGVVVKYPLLVEGVPTAVVAEPGVPVGVPAGATVSPWAEDLQGNLLTVFDPITGAQIVPCGTPYIPAKTWLQDVEGSTSITLSGENSGSKTYSIDADGNRDTDEPFFLVEGDQLVITETYSAEGFTCEVADYLYSPADNNGVVTVTVVNDCQPNTYVVHPKKIWVNEVPGVSTAELTYSFSDDREPVTVTFNADGDIVDGPSEFVLPIGVSIIDVTEEYNVPDGWSCEVTTEAPATQLTPQGGRKGSSLKVYNDCEETPRPDPKVEYGEWTDGEWKCDDTTVTQTTTRTTTPYIWVDGEWVEDTDNATTVTETRTRDLTAEEQTPCPVPPPPPPVDVCPNVTGDQPVLPDGQKIDENGNCYVPTSSPPSESSLPNTGSDTDGPLRLGLGLLALGFAGVFFGRRRHNGIITQ